MKNKLKFLVTNLIIISMLCGLLFASVYNTSFASTVKNENVIYNGNRKSNKISLMFNVYWGSEYIIDILNTLDEFNVKTTFFIGGTWAEKNEEYVKEIIFRGHELGNHGYFHLNHDKLNYSQNHEEILATHNLIKVNYNYSMKLFAPPSGAYNTETINSAIDLGYLTIMWSKDTIDWRDKDENIIYNRATKNVSGGELILMHPTQATSNALKKCLSYYSNNKLLVSTVSDTIS